LSIGALVAVIAQGALGGMRVLMDEVQLAKIHGCVGPAFFAYAAALAAITSRRWQQAAAGAGAAVSKIERLAILTTFLAYCQLVLGAQLRHLPAGANPGMFRVMLFFHLLVAAALVAHVLVLALRTLRAGRYDLSLVRPATALAALVLLQVALGVSTWAGKYGWPAWMGDFGFAARHVVRADSNHQVWMITAHVATGSLILVCSLLVSLRAGRLTWRGSRSANSVALKLEAAG
jgi:cytochrome c oxidase assembly protein subunit 15